MQRSQSEFSHVQSELRNSFSVVQIVLVVDSHITCSVSLVRGLNIETRGEVLVVFGYFFWGPKLVVEGVSDLRSLPLGNAWVIHFIVSS